MIRYVVGDTKPDLSFVLQEDGVDVTADVEITAVEFRLKKASVVLTKPLTLVTHPDGSKAWEGNFGVGDLDETGPLFAEIVVFRGSTNPQHGVEPIQVVIRGEFTEAP